MAHRDVVVIGASAGGIEALQKVVGGLPANFGAAVLVVLHTAGRSRSLLPQVLERAGRLPASHPQNGTSIRSGHIYIAPPNFHMLVEGKQLHVMQGPRENLHRPAIDPLFRSAAVSHGQRVIAVVLSGMMDDGTSGLMVVRAHGGATIVQDPETAMFSAMPQHALEQVPDARVLPPEKIAGELVRLVGAELPPEISAGEDRELVEVKETRFLEQEMPQIEDDERPGRPSPYACPDCGGVLWELEQEGFLRFRCRVGHAFTARHLDLEQRHAIETSLWSALRALEESASLYHQMAERAADGRRAESAVHLKEQARSSDENARVLREFLVHVNSGTEEAAD